MHNPSWLTPYLSCVLVAAGLLVQFLGHLIPFLKRRLAAPGSATVPAAAARSKVTTKSKK